MSTCKICRRNIPDGGRFCPYCGQPMGEPEKTYNGYRYKLEYSVISRTESGSYADKFEKVGVSFSDEIGRHGECFFVRAAKGMFGKIFMRIVSIDGNRVLYTVEKAKQIKSLVFHIFKDDALYMKIEMTKPQHGFYTGFVAEKNGIRREFEEKRNYIGVVKWVENGTEVGEGGSSVYFFNDLELKEPFLMLMAAECFYSM